MRGSGSDNAGRLQAPSALLGASKLEGRQRRRRLCHACCPRPGAASPDDLGDSPYHDLVGTDHIEVTEALLLIDQHQRPSRGHDHRVIVNRVRRVSCGRTTTCPRLRRSCASGYAVESATCRAFAIHRTRRSVFAGSHGTDSGPRIRPGAIPESRAQTRSRRSDPSPHRTRGWCACRRGREVR